MLLPGENNENSEPDHHCDDDEFGDNDDYDYEEGAEGKEIISMILQ